MLSNCSAGENSWESLGLQGDQTSQPPPPNPTVDLSEVPNGLSDWTTRKEKAATKAGTHQRAKVRWTAQWSVTLGTGQEPPLIQSQWLEEDFRTLWWSGVGFGGGGPQRRSKPTHLTFGGGHVPRKRLVYCTRWHPSQVTERRCKPARTQSLTMESVRFGEPVDCSLPGSSVHGILQARILEWVFNHRSD